MNRWLIPTLAATLLTVTEAAEFTGTTERTIRRWIAAGMPSLRRNGRVYVDVADLNRQEAATRRHGGRPRKWQRERAMS